MTRLLICMADAGQDPTEVAVPFHIFKSAGFSVDFATEHGAVPAADPRMLETSLFGRFWVRNLSLCRQKIC
jgi:putative intracellular protease/amidase